MTKSQKRKPKLRPIHPIRLQMQFINATQALRKFVDELEKFSNDLVRFVEQEKSK